MASRSGREPLARLLRLILALQAHRYPNAGELARLCEVSRRTIYRDLETLAAAGIPIQYVAERQGYQLAPSFLFHAPGLDEREAVALLVLAHAGDRDDALGLRRDARGGAWKLANALQGESQGRVRALAELIHVRDHAVDCVPERRPIYERLLEAMARRVQIRVEFLESSSTELQTSKVSPYRLIIGDRTWSLIGRSTLHRDVHAFRLPWVRRVELTDEPYTIPPRFTLERFLGRAWSQDRGQDRVDIWLRFSAKVALEVAEVRWHATQRSESLADGSLDMHLSLDGVHDVLGWILGFGDQVEVVAPDTLRDLVREVAQRVVLAHATGKGPDARPQAGRRDRRADAGNPDRLGD